MNETSLTQQWAIDHTTPLSTFGWTERCFNDRYRFLMSDHIWNDVLKRPLLEGKNGVYREFEKAHYDDMEALLKPKHTLMDIGTEMGWQIGVFAHFCDPNKIILVEPQPLVWPNIRDVWRVNNYGLPLATFCGFISDKTQVSNQPGHFINHQSWPPFDPQEVDYGRMLLGGGFRAFKEFAAYPQSSFSLDDFTQNSGIIPDAITADIEGGEILLVRGAKELFTTHHPLVWLSIHTQPAGPHDSRGSIAYDYDSSKEEVLEIMASYGYQATYLGIDCEEHWRFEKK